MPTRVEWYNIFFNFRKRALCCRWGFIFIGEFAAKFSFSRNPRELQINIFWRINNKKKIIKKCIILWRGTQNGQIGFWPGLRKKKFVLLSLHFRLLIKNKEKKVKNLTWLAQEAWPPGGGHKHWAAPGCGRKHRHEPKDSNFNLLL